MPLIRVIMDFIVNLLTYLTLRSKYGYWYGDFVKFDWQGQNIPFRLTGMLIDS